MFKSKFVRAEKWQTQPSSFLTQYIYLQNKYDHDLSNKNFYSKITKKNASVANTKLHHVCNVAASLLQINIQISVRSASKQQHQLVCVYFEKFLKNITMITELIHMTWTENQSLDINDYSPQDLCCYFSVSE